MTMNLNQRMANAAARAYEAHCCAIEDLVLTEGAVDVVATDPPYSKRTQDNIRSGKDTSRDISGPVLLGFDPADNDRRARWSAWIARAVRRLALVFSDHEGSMVWANYLERAGMEYIRCVPWIKTGDVELTSQPPRKSGAPQFTGDRPAQAHEIIVVARSRRVPMRWNGGGKQGLYTHAVVPPSERVHPNQKPVELVRALLRDFCSPGETLADPFCGAGTTLVAAKHLGLPAFGSDMTKRWADYTRRRAQAAARLNAQED